MLCAHGRTRLFRATVSFFSFRFRTAGGGQLFSRFDRRRRRLPNWLVFSMAAGPERCFIGDVVGRWWMLHCAASTEQ